MSEESSLGARTRTAVIWAFLATAGTRLLTLLSLMVLARMLAPREFGLLAFALVYTTYAETVGDLGTAVALIYWRERRDDAAQVTFAINAVMGAFWCVTTLLLAPAIAGFFRVPEGTAIVRVLSFGFLIKFLGNTHDALAQKDLRFRARAVPELSLAGGKAVVAVSLASLGFGAWSLVWGHLAGLFLWSFASWRMVSWRPSLRLPRDLAGPMLRYGRGIVGVNVLAAIVHHSDVAIVGRVLGPAALGLYQIAWKIPEATIAVIIWVVSRVLFPTFSKIREGPELARAYLTALTYVSLVTLPLAGVLVVAAEPLVGVFLGERWMEAAPLLRWLAVYAGLRAIGTHAGDVLKSTGRTSLLAALSAARAVVLVPALFLAAHAGVTKVAMTLAAVTAVAAVANIGIVMRLLRFDVRAVGRALRTSVVAGTALALAGGLLQAYGPPLPAQLSLAATVFAGGLAWAVAIFVLDRALLRDLKRLVAPQRGQ